MSQDRLLSLADAAFGLPTRGEFQLELLVSMVPAVCDGCAIELFGRDLPPEEAAIWSPFRKLLQSPSPVAFRVASSPEVDTGTTADLSEGETAILEQIGIRSAIGIPLRLEGRLVGSFTVFMGSSGRTFTESDLTLFRQVANRLETRLTADWLEGTQPIKVARGEEIGLLARKHSFGRLERYAAEREVGEHRRQQDAVADLAGRAIVETDLGSILRTAAGCVAEILGLEHVKVLELLPEEEVFVIRAVVGFPEQFVDRFRVPLRRASQAGFTLEVGETIRSPHFERETRFEIPDIEGFDLRSGMCVVIGGAQSPWGVLEASTTEPREYTDDEARFMKTVADILGQAIERNASEAQLRYQATLLDTIAEAVAALDRQGRLVYLNHRAERMFGWTTDELKEWSILEALAAPSEGARFGEIRKSVMGEGGWSGPLQVVARDGREFTVHLTSARATDDRGEVIGTVLTALDVTERLELEDRLRHAQKMEGMGRLAGGVAHDFNNLLTTITGFAELLLDEPDCAGTTREFAEEIKGASSRAKALTGQLLAFSRRQALLPQVSDPRELVRSMEPLLRRMVGEHIQLAIRIGPPSGRILVDPVQMEQVVTNLVTNARDAMPHGGVLTLSVRSRALSEPTQVGEAELPRGRYVVIEVEDTGSGIDPEVQPRVFDPFFTTKPRGRGTGLGLSSVYGIVQQSRGGIALESELGRGTTFSVFLPEIEPTENEGPGEEEKEGPKHGGTRPGEPSAQGRTVLVVEDEASVRSLLVRLLPRLGYRVLEANHGAEALELCRAQVGRIDLVLTDVVMPTMSGPALAAVLEEEQPDLPVLYMSGYADEELAGQDILQQGTPFLQKPFTLDELGSYLERAGESGGARRPEG